MNVLKIWKQMLNNKKVEAWRLKPNTKAVIWGKSSIVKHVELCDGHGDHKLQFIGSWGEKSVPALRIVFNDGREMIVHPKRRIHCAAIGDVSAATPANIQLPDNVAVNAPQILIASES